MTEQELELLKILESTGDLPGKLPAQGEHYRELRQSVLREFDKSQVQAISQKSRDTCPRGERTRDRTSTFTLLRGGLVAIALTLCLLLAGVLISKIGPLQHALSIAHRRDIFSGQDNLSVSIQQLNSLLTDSSQDLYFAGLNAAIIEFQCENRRETTL